MRYNIEEPAEDKIAKQALLEALFDTQLWSEPYVTNPFIYVTDHDLDFAGEEGAKRKSYFKKVFMSQYLKYTKVIKDNTPDETYLIRSQAKKNAQEKLSAAGLA